MNIAPINYNQNRAKTQMSQPKFGALHINIGRKITEVDNTRPNILNALASSFPHGTVVERYLPDGDIVSIRGVSQIAENVIARALNAAGLEVKQNPFELTKEQDAIKAGLEELEAFKDFLG